MLFIVAGIWKGEKQFIQPIDMMSGQGVCAQCGEVYFVGG